VNKLCAAAKGHGEGCIAVTNLSITQDSKYTEAEYGLTRACDVELVS